MTLSMALDLAHTLWVDEHRKFGTTMEASLENVQEWAAGFTGEKKRKTEDQIARENDENLAILKGLMGGTGTGF